MNPLSSLPLLDRKRFLGPDPAPRPPRRPLLPLLHALHPRIPALESRLAHVLPRQLAARAGKGRADVDLVRALAGQGDVAGEHVQVPEGEAGGEAGGLLGQGDGFGELEAAEERVPLVGAQADGDEFDFGDDEAVARVGVAHEAVQVGEAGQVERLLAVLLAAHARVPELKGLDEPDDAAAAEGVRLRVGVGGQEEGAVFLGALGQHRDVVVVALAGLEGGVGLGGVEGRDGVLEAALVGRLDEGLAAGGGFREGGGRDGDVEEARRLFAVGEVGDGHDGLKVEVFPVFQVAYVPPAVHVVADTRGNLFDQGDCWIRSRQIVHNGGRWPIEAKFRCEITIPG